MDQAKTNLPSFKASTKKYGKLPPTLYIQADNSGKDNENNFVIMFLAHIVKAKVFKKIKLMFLLVGHTHEDIDQMFSKVSERLHERNALTLPQLHEAIRENYHPVPDVQKLEALWNFKELFNGAHKLVGIQSPHCFKFQLGRGGNVEFFYKDWPLKDQQYKSILLKEIPVLRRPNPVVPSIASVTEVFEKLEKDLKSYREHGRLSDNDVEWWRNYFVEQKNVRLHQPRVPLPSSLPKYSEPTEDRILMVDSSLREAINNHIDRLQINSQTWQSEDKTLMLSDGQYEECRTSSWYLVKIDKS